jgi:voltage-gated potassium channel
VSDTLRHKTFVALEIGAQTDSPARWLRRFIIVLIIANVAAVIVQTHVGDAHLRFFRNFELFSVIVFSLEYIARTWTASEAPSCAGLTPFRARLKYLRSPLAIIDLIAIAPFYLSLFVTIDLRYLRALRLLRLLKLSHYFPGIEIFMTVLRTQASALMAALLVIVVLILVSAIAMFSLENEIQPDAFPNAAASIWWAVVTLTSVGYGDVVPITYGGRVLGVVIMLLGVGVVALPAAMLAARFSEEIRVRGEELSVTVADFVKDGRLNRMEKGELERLRKQLGISEDSLQRMVDLEETRSVAVTHCPHCGEAISDEP